MVEGNLRPLKSGHICLSVPGCAKDGCYIPKSHNSGKGCELMSMHKLIVIVVVW